jgi:extracellular factor (EF) 3-hydroxypalmitic acid methyl ester biosynthesis protein
MLAERTTQRMAHPYPRRLRSAALPARLTAAVEDFKSEMLAVDKQLIAGAASETEAQQRVSQACTSVIDDFRLHIECDQAQVEELAAYMFRETSPYFHLSRTLDRCYAKPRGYAGDYLTLEMMYNDEAGGDRRLGSYVDRWALDTPAARAVKNRRRLLADIITAVAAENQNHRVQVTSVASGPARELFDALRSHHTRELRATCVDIDPDALAYTREIANRTGVADRLCFVQANAVKVALGRASMQLPDQHLVYTVGLIDYLPDGLVVALLDWIHDRLRPGGTAIVGNFDVVNPSKALMDHVLEWKLIHRSAQHLVALFAQSKFGEAPVDVRAESTGVNLFASATRD